MRGIRHIRGSDMGRHMEMMGIRVPQKAVQRCIDQQVASDSAGAPDSKADAGDDGPKSRESTSQQQSRKRKQEEEDFRSSVKPKVDAVVPKFVNLQDLDEMKDGLGELATPIVVESLQELLDPIMNKGKIKKLTVTMELEDGEIISLMAEL